MSEIPLSTVTGQPITHAELVKALAKTGEKVIADLTPQSAHLFHMASCVMGEVAELIEGILLDKGSDNLLEEAGDIEFYVQGIRQEFDLKYSAAFIPDIRKKDPLPWAVIHAGHVFDKIKQISMYVKPLDTLGLVQALNALSYELVKVYNMYGFTRNQALHANIIKLSKRYTKMTFSNEAAQARADKT